VPLGSSREYHSIFVREQVAIKGAASPYLCDLIWRNVREVANISRSEAVRRLVENGLVK